MKEQSTPKPMKTFNLKFSQVPRQDREELLFCKVQGQHSHNTDQKDATYLTREVTKKGKTEQTNP